MYYITGGFLLEVKAILSTCREGDLFYCHTKKRPLDVFVVCMATYRTCHRQLPSDAWQQKTAGRRAAFLPPAF
jgi:hypothetical protein